MISRCDAPPPLSDKHYLAFLSHHKADAGDAARIFVDTAKRLFEASAEHEASYHGNESPLSRSPMARRGSATDLGEAGRQASVCNFAQENTKIFLEYGAEP